MSETDEASIHAEIESIAENIDAILKKIDAACPREGDPPGEARSPDTRQSMP